MRNGGVKIPSEFCRRLTRPPRRHPDKWIRSPGVRYVDEALRGRWLVNLILLHQQQHAFIDAGRQTWRLSRPCGGRTPTKACIVCTDEGGQSLLSISLFTDFAAPGIEIVVDDGALFLPSEDWRDELAIASRSVSRALQMATWLQKIVGQPTSRRTSRTHAVHLPPPP